MISRLLVASYCHARGIRDAALRRAVIVNFCYFFFFFFASDSSLAGELIGDENWEARERKLEKKKDKRVGWITGLVSIYSLTECMQSARAASDGGVVVVVVVRCICR